MQRPYTLNDIDTDSACAVSSFIANAAVNLYGITNPDSIKRLFVTLEKLYAGEHAGYQAIDTAYHDLEHTLQVTLCWARMVENYHLVAGEKSQCADYFENGLAACLFHDTGYLKDGKDDGGTGAKFTLVHESRSCDVAEVVLKEMGWDQKRIESVQRIISATGPRAVMDAIPFKTDIELTIGQMVATADFMAQMSDPKYVRKLPKLFKEFEEFDQTRGLAECDRSFPSLEALIAQTPIFWRDFVLPRLEEDYGSYYKYLAVPYPDGPNPYLEQVEINMKLIDQKT